jgi:6-pyruvoyltetrahydropterin/6-carboxytetrahydropterin synthase
MFRISKQFSFCAAHSLNHLPEGHQCKRVHGHNYIVELVLEAQSLNSDHFVRDYGELKAFKKWIDDVVDHRNLNDVMGETPSTAENLAFWLYMGWKETYPELVGVRVSETPKTWAEYWRAR